MGVISLVKKMKKILILLSFALILFTSACQMTYECGPVAEWSYDGSTHWHACAIPSCTDKYEEEEHSFGKWVENEDGVEERECAVCGYVEDKNTVPEGHEHNYSSKWNSNKDEHWHSCNGCSIPSEKGAHEWVEESRVEATYKEEGKIVKICSVCDYEIEETIPVIEHTCSYESTWSHDDESHWHACSLCGDPKDKATHSFVLVDNGEIQNVSCSGCTYKSSRALTDTWDKTSISASLLGTGTEADPYQIHSGADLAYLKNNASSMSGKHVKLMRNIDANGSNFIIDIFDGVLDGNNYAIKGINIVDYQNSGTGFIRTLNTNGVLKNLTLEGSITGFTLVGAFAGASNGTITNCTNRINIVGGNDGVWTAGGITAKNKGTISNCQNYGSITNGRAECGGIVGWHETGKVSDCTNYGAVSSTDWAVGGVAGKATAELENCTNNGKIMAVGHLGGIVGNTNAKVVGCVNNGEVTYAQVSGNKGSMGGVVGHTNGAIDSCQNNGYIHGAWGEVGGIAGRAEAAITNCSNNAQAYIDGGAWSVGGIAGVSKATITLCKNYSAVKGADGGIGGIVGEMEANTNTTIDSCENFGSVSGNYNMGGIVGFLRNNSVKDSKNHGEIVGISSVGGVVGSMHVGKVTNCENASEASVKGSDTTGGVIGKVEYDASLKATISGCTNNGTVRGTWYHIGGIFGNADAATISGCTNNGTVSSENDCVGGIAGAFFALATVENCTNKGAISGTTNVGGIVHENQATLTNCDNYGSVTATNADGVANGICSFNNNGTIDATCEDLR